MPRRRYAYEEEEAERGASDDAMPPCWLCERPLGQRVEWHHPVPKSRKGRQTVPVHPICHRTVHAQIDNKTLADVGFDRDRLISEAGLSDFLRWIADKPPDFHAATRRAKEKAGPWKEKGRR